MPAETTATDRPRPEAAEMRIRAIAPWFGGKRTMAQDIVAELGPHTAYVEPFCGSLAVLLAKPPAQSEVVSDLHGDLTNLARCLQSDATAVELYDRLQRTLFSESILKDSCARLAAEITSDEPDVDRAYCDPPYCPESRSGYDGTGAHARYAHEFDHALDHGRLRDSLARFQKARVVISYYDCPRVRELYRGWTIIDKTRLKNLTNAAGPESKKAAEILIVNGPSDTAPAADTETPRLF
jgi:site-specific DNA-adenine methylase